MSDPKDLRRNAQDCLTHAQAATGAQDKFLLLNIAQAWLKLSQQVEQLQAEREMRAEEPRRRRRPRSLRRCVGRRSGTVALLHGALDRLLRVPASDREREALCLALQQIDTPPGLAIGAVNRRDHFGLRAIGET